MLGRIWASMKRWRRVTVGPVALHYSFRRAVKVRRSSAHHLGHGPHVLHGATSAKVARPIAPQPSGEVAVIMGVGPGLGAALASRLAASGLTVVAVSRLARNHDELIGEVRSVGGRIYSYACDATDERSVARLLDEVTRTVGAPSLVVYSLQWCALKPALDVTVPEYEESWRHNCLGPFLLAREAGRAMVRAGQGTIVLIGSTSSVLAREQHLSFAMGKFGMRAVAQVLARELWPLGVHVAHLLVDADIEEREEAWPQADPEHIAQAIEMLHRQPRSTWTSELDLRPWNERFWEHC